MQDIRHHKESFFYSRFWIAILVIFFVITAFSIYKMYRKYDHAKTIRDDFQIELLQTKQHQAELQKNIDSLSTDRGKESEIRDRYRVVKDGEQMILIVDNQESPKLTPPPSKPLTFWQKIINVFH
jgi:cell division protein FtsB